MTLVEQNEKLAKFMGYEGQHEEWCGNNILEHNPFLGGMQAVSFDPEKRWDQLMPIVEKLDLIDGYTCISIDHDCVFLHRKGGEMLDFKNKEEGSKISAVYKAVCAGIEWIEVNNKS